MAKPAGTGSSLSLTCSVLTFICNFLLTHRHFQAVVYILLWERLVQVEKDDQCFLCLLISSFDVFFSPKHVLCT